MHLPYILIFVHNSFLPPIFSNYMNYVALLMTVNIFFVIQNIMSLRNMIKVFVFRYNFASYTYI